ncbi:hypothetical protein [Haloarcula marismortui]|nr:hypothetical protein [Haloarcula marismortui]
MTRAGSVLLAALIVCSAVIGAAGPALAQTTETDTPQSDTTTLEFNGGENILVVDTTDMSGTVTVTFSTKEVEGSGGSSQPLVKEEFDTTTTDGVAMANLGAYDTVTATVEGEGTPTTSTHGGRAVMPDGYTMLGGTGGDADIQCGIMESIGRAVDSGFTQLDCTANPGTTTVNTTGTDAQQTKLDIYQSAQNSKAQADNYQTTLDNYLSDTKTQARIIGKNAYIRSLNNGSSKSAAKTEAKQAVQDYYSVKQENLIAEWNTQIEHWKYLRSTAESESGIDSRFVRVDDADYYSEPYTYYDRYTGNSGTETKTLVNGTTVDSATFEVEEVADDGGTTINNQETVGIESGVLDSNIDTRWLGVSSTDTTDGPVKMVVFEDYETSYAAIESQSDTVESNMDTLAENTYSAYQQGEINSSDLVDPYMLSSQQSPGDDFQGWTAAQLTLLGTNSPENFDQIGSFNVTTESGTQYEGVLFSQENPASGQFENGTTYNTSNIGGTQYVVTSDRIVELDGEFTIDSISTQDGQTVQNVTIEKTTYETSNVTELKQQYEDLAYKRAQIEAREKALKQSAGGGLLGGGSVPPVVALAVIGTLLAIVVLQN